MNILNIRISNCAQDIANYAREMHALESMWVRGQSNQREIIDMRNEDIAAEFESLAEMLGYRVERREALEVA